MCSSTRGSKPAAQMPKLYLRNFTGLELAALENGHCETRRGISHTRSMSFVGMPTQVHHQGS